MTLTAPLLAESDEEDRRALDALAGTRTKVPVLYRDACNYKRDETYVLSGMFTDGHGARLRAALEAGACFIPTQVGLDHLGETFDTGFPTRDDHVWHEIDVDDIETVSGGGDVLMTVGEFVALIEGAAAQGWDELAGELAIGLNEIEEW